MIQHECRICEELILLDNEAIKLHVRKHWHVIKPKEYFNKYMKDSRMLRNPATEEEETLAIREEEQAMDILADLDDIVIPMMDKDACADIAEDDDSTNPTKESRMEKKNPNEPRPERSGVGEKSGIETLAKDDEMEEKPRDDKIADVITLDDEQEGGEDALTRAVEGEQFGNSELKVLEKEPSDPQEQSEHNKNIEAETNVLPKNLGPLSKPNDHNYEENRKQKVNLEDNVCRRKPSTTEEQSTSATSLRLVSLANLVPKSPPSPTQPIIDPTPNWTVAEVVKPDFIISLSSRAIPLPKILVLLFVPLTLSRTLQYPRSELVSNLFDDLCTDHWLSLLTISVLSTETQIQYTMSVIPKSFLQGTVTPVAPGTKIVSSNVVRLSRDEVLSQNH